MRTTARAATVGLLAAGVAVLTPTGAAVADPKGGEDVHLVCGSTHYDILAAPGGGLFTPGLVVDSTTVLVPVRFGAFTATVRNAAGTVVATYAEPAVDKGSTGKQAGALTCTFTETETATLTAAEAAEEGLPGAGTYTFTGTGTVLVQVTGR